MQGLMLLKINHGAICGGLMELLLYKIEAYKMKKVVFSLLVMTAIYSGGANASTKYECEI